VLNVPTVLYPAPEVEKGISDHCLSSLFASSQYGGADIIHFAEAEVVCAVFGLVKVVFE